MKYDQSDELMLTCKILTRKVSDMKDGIKSVEVSVAYYTAECGGSDWGRVGGLKRAKAVIHWHAPVSKYGENVHKINMKT